MIKEGEMTKGMNTMEEIIEEENMLQVTMRKIFVHKRSQNSLGMKVMLQINLNILLFPLLLVNLLRIQGIIGWLIVGPLITSLVARKFSLIW